MNIGVSILASLLCVGASLSQSTSAALERGRELKWQMRGQTLFRREAVRIGAVRSFRVGLRGGGDPKERSLCALRAGELLGAAGLEDAALAEASAGAGLDPSEWSHRCAILAGAALIAKGRHEEAMGCLGRVTGAGVPSRFSEAARVLLGVSLLERGHKAEAVRAWRAIGEDGVSPRARLDSFERWGAALLRDGDLAGAAGVLHLCREQMSATALESTVQGREVRALLRRSRLATGIRRALCLRLGEESPCQVTICPESEALSSSFRCDLQFATQSANSTPVFSRSLRERKCMRGPFGDSIFGFPRRHRW